MYICIFLPLNVQQIYYFTDTISMIWKRGILCTGIRLEMLEIVITLIILIFLNCNYSVIIHTYCLISFSSIQITHTSTCSATVILPDSFFINALPN